MGQVYNGQPVKGLLFLFAQYGAPLLLVWAGLPATQTGLNVLLLVTLLIWLGLCS
jgi:hypothetical protein